MKKQFTFFIAVLFYVSQIGSSQTNCPEPSAHININTNKINAKISNGGYLFRDGNDNYGAFQVPYFNGDSPATISGAGLWLGAYTGLPNNPILRLSSVDYGQNGNSYYPGPLTDIGTIGGDTCANWNKIWTVTRAEIESHISDFEDNGVIDNPNPNILGFPCKGNDEFFQINGFDLPGESTSSQGFANFHDHNFDGVYNAMAGDYPIPRARLIPSQMSWCVFNNVGNGASDAGRLEIQLTTWSVRCLPELVLENTVFTTYRIINRGQDPLDSLHMGMWVDFDLGCSTDDYIGCNPDLNTFYVYNQDQIDGEPDGSCPAGVSTYNIEPPVQSVTFMDTRMNHFMTYQNGGVGNPPPGTTDPITPVEKFNYLSGSWRDGTPLTEGGNGYNPGSIDLVDYAFPGDPNELSEWSMESISATDGDVRAVASTGKFNFIDSTFNSALNSQGIFETTLAWSFHQGETNDRLENITLMSSRITQLKYWYKNYILDYDPCSFFSATDEFDFGKNITLFPNPNNGTFELDFPNEKISQLQVFDVSGKMIWGKEENVENNITIHLQNVSNGIYFLKGKMDDGFFYKKIVIGK